MTSLTHTKVMHDAEENLFLVYDRDGDVQDGYESYWEAMAVALDLEVEYAQEAKDEKIEEVRSDIQGLMEECDNLELLLKIKAMLNK